MKICGQLLNLELGTLNFWSSEHRAKFTLAMSRRDKNHGLKGHNLELQLRCLICGQLLKQSRIYVGKKKRQVRSKGHDLLCLLATHLSLFLCQLSFVVFLTKIR